MKDAFAEWYAEVIDASQAILTEEQEAALQILDDKRLGGALTQGYISKKTPAEMATKIASML